MPTLIEDFDTLVQSETFADEMRVTNEIHIEHAKSAFDDNLNEATMTTLLAFYGELYTKIYALIEEINLKRISLEEAWLKWRENEFLIRNKLHILTESEEEERNKISVAKTIAVNNHKLIIIKVQRILEYLQSTRNKFDRLEDATEWNIHVNYESEYKNAIGQEDKDEKNTLRLASKTKQRRDFTAAKIESINVDRARNKVWDIARFLLSTDYVEEVLDNELSKLGTEWGEFLDTQQLQ